MITLACGRKIQKKFTAERERRESTSTAATRSVAQWPVDTPQICPSYNFGAATSQPRSVYFNLSGGGHALAENPYKQRPFPVISGKLGSAWAVPSFINPKLRTPAAADGASRVPLHFQIPCRIPHALMTRRNPLSTSCCSAPATASCQPLASTLPQPLHFTCGQMQQNSFLSHCHQLAKNKCTFIYLERAG